MCWGSDNSPRNLDYMFGRGGLSSLVPTVRGTVCVAATATEAEDALFIAKVRAVVLAEAASPRNVFQVWHLDHSGRSWLTPTTRPFRARLPAAA
jgi:hypothetical protein